MFRILLLPLVVLALGSTSCKSGPEPHYKGKTEPVVQPPLSGDTYKVLFIGNSLTLDATYLLPSLLNAAKVRNIELTRTFHGNYTLPLYNNNYAGKGICSWTTWKPGQDRWRGKLTLDHCLKEVVEAEAYDIICIQESTVGEAGWSWTSSEKMAVTGLVSKIKDSQRLKGNDSPRFVYLLSTQYGRDYSKLVNNFDNDPEKHFEACATTAAEILTATGIDTIISTGALQQNLRTTGLNSVRDMTRGDLIHMDYGAMRYAAACLVFKTLFTPITGKKAEDIPFSFEEYYPYSTLYTTPVTDEARPVLMAAVQAAYEKPLKITDLSSYTVSPVYTHKPGTVTFDDYADVEPVTFPVEFPIGGKVNDTYKQPYWASYGIWFSDDQQQAYIKWNFASYPLPGIIPPRTFATTDDISSPSLRGPWTDDWFEFVIPVKDFAAGSSVRLTAPFYTRQGPVFWAFEWLDGNVWKSDCKDITVDGFTRKASFALGAGTTQVSCTATFENAVWEGRLHLRVRCVDGTIQADSQSGKAVQRSLPNHTSSEYSSVFYFYDSASPVSALRLEKL